MTQWEEIYAAEKEIELCSFNAQAAWKLGSRLVAWGRERHKVLVVRISMNHHLLFHYAFDGTAAENDAWVERKENMVYYTGHSSYAASLYLKEKQQTPLERYGLPADGFAASGGSVPLRLKGSGVVGAVTVSGMSQAEDHALVMDMLRQYQQEEKAEK